MPSFESAVEGDERRVVNTHVLIWTLQFALLKVKPVTL